jgi:hypothetical protein
MSAGKLAPVVAQVMLASLFPSSFPALPAYELAILLSSRKQ